MGTLELVVVWVVLDDPTNFPDMQKVEILPPADFECKISAKGQNQTPLQWGLSRDGELLKKYSQKPYY